MVGIPVQGAWAGRAVCAQYGERPASAEHNRSAAAAPLFALASVDPGLHAAGAVGGSTARVLQLLHAAGVLRAALASRPCARDRGLACAGWTSGVGAAHGRSTAHATCTRALHGSAE